MNKKQVIKLFEEQKVRMEWDDEKGSHGVGR